MMLQLLVAMAVVMMLASAEAHDVRRIVFEPPVLVDANQTAISSHPTTSDVGPPEGFWRVGAAKPGATHIFGPGTTPGPPARFDFSSDSGAHWAGGGGVIATGAPSGVARTYGLPVGQAVRFSSSNPNTYHNFSSSGWRELGASTVALAENGSLAAEINHTAEWEWSGIPEPGINVTASLTFNSPRVYPIIALPGGGWLAGVCIVWNGIEPHNSPDGPFPPLSILAFRSDDGYKWRFASVIANESQVPWSTFGPNEHDLTVLGDNSSLMAAIRIDGDAGCSSGTYRYYYQSYSTDSGSSWTVPRSIHGAGCARPRLMRIEPSGPLLMSGGRLCVENTTGIFLWVNRDAMASLDIRDGGDGNEWERYSIAYHHDLLWDGPDYLKFGQEINDTRAFRSLSYTSLIQTGPSSGAILYNIFLDPYAWPPWPCANFIMRFSFKSDDDAAQLLRPAGSHDQWVAGEDVAVVDSGHRQQPPPGFVQDRFAISFFLDPSPTDAAYSFIREANFSVLLGANNPENITQANTMLQLCKKYDLKCITNLRAWAKRPTAKNTKKPWTFEHPLPKTSSNHWGFYLVDEPNADEYAGLATTVATIRSQDPHALSFINLLPSNVSGYGMNNATGWAKEWGAKDYRSYVQQLVDTVRPDIVCFDHYPTFGRLGLGAGQQADERAQDTREDYVRNLRIVGNITQNASIPMWLYFNIMPYGGNHTSMPHEGHEDPTEAQVRWQVFQAIAYGAKGLLYFAFHPSGGMPGGLVRCVAKPGMAPCSNPLQPTHHYYQAKRINSAVLAMAPILMRTTILGITELRYETVPQPRTALAAMAENCGLLDISRGDWTVSCFALSAKAVDNVLGWPVATATKALMISNFEHAFTQYASVKWACAKTQPLSCVNHTVHEIDQSTGEAREVEDDEPDMPGFQLYLDAGSARLFVIQARHEL